MLKIHSQNSLFPEAFARAVESNFWERREQLWSRRLRDDAAFVARFGWAQK
jgi:hypothetical protein